MVMKRILAALFLLIASVVPGAAQFAQGGFSNGGGGAGSAQISGTFNPNNLVVSGPGANQIQDGSQVTNTNCSGSSATCVGAPDLVQASGATFWRFYLSSASTGLLFKTNAGTNIFRVTPAFLQADVPLLLVPPTTAPTTWSLGTNAQIAEQQTWTGAVTTAIAFAPNFMQHTFNNSGAPLYSVLFLQGFAGPNENANLYVIESQAGLSANTSNSIEIHAGRFSSFVSFNMNGATADAIGLKGGVQADSGKAVKMIAAIEGQTNNNSASTLYSLGIYSQFTGTVNGSSIDAAFAAFGNGGTVVWKTVYGVANDTTFQNPACGSSAPCTILGPLGAGSMAIGTGIDFTKFTTSGNFYQDGNVTITGAGQIKVAAMTQSAAAQSGTMCYNTTGGVITYDATLGCLASSALFKTDISSISDTDALNIALQLKPVSFRKRPEAGGDVDHDMQVGFLAEQVDGVDRRLTAREADGTVRGVRYQQLTAILAGALHKLKADNDDLRAILGARR